MKKRVLISACLAGWRCRYDGGDKLNKRLVNKALRAGWSLVPVCPEVLGGLGIPREKAVIEKGDGAAAISGKSRVLNASGKDVTGQFTRGAEKALESAILTGCGEAFLMEGSPSCGVTVITGPSGDKRAGRGVTAALLERHGVAIIGRK